MSGLRLTNTYSRSVEPFIPADSEGKSVLMYTCGPTVYSYAHIGNFRTFLFSDLLRRVLERSGYTVRQVMNITDVGHLTEDDMADASGEDKLVEAARKMGWDPYRVADHFREAFEADARTLRLRIYSPEEAAQDDLHPKATRHIPEMLAMLDTLIEKGHAYTDSTGQVYFSIESFPEYGKLSNKVIDDLESGSRVSVRAEKRDPRDFALWKVDGTHLMQWDPHSAEGWPAEDWERLQRMLPNGVRPEIKKGFPGWHIECSAMSLACLAETIDIHTGGEDNIFPHHECEIAQSCCALDVSVPGPSPDDEPRRSFAKYWVHSRHLLVDGRKMSKRDGTFFTVRNLLDPEGSDRADLVPRLKAVGFDEGKVTGEDLRLALLWGRYSQPMNFSLDLLARAHKARLRMQTLYERTTEVAAEGDAAEAIVTASTKALADFDEALQDDLNVDRAMAILFEYVAQMNQAETGPAEAAQIQTALESFDQVLEILIRRRTGVVSAADLNLWCTPEHRVARAEALSVWRDDPGRVDLYTALNAGEVPAVDAFAQLGTDLSDAEVEALVGLRYAARKAKNWGVADAIRDHVKVAGISIEDSPDGARWKIA